MIWFAQRMEIEELFLEWCKENNVANKPNSLVVFMLTRDWLNEDKILKDLKNIGKEKETQATTS